jgi:triacylglycerol esterase/lipase EstA (alpha/beta hydrolase family)
LEIIRGSLRERVMFFGINRVMAVGRESISFLILLGLLFPLSCRGGHDIEKVDCGKTPVFFIHAHGSGPKTWGPMISYLIKRGYPKMYLEAIELEPSNGTNIPAAGKQIAPAIEEFLNRINAFCNKQHGTHQLATKINIISHSMGALSSRWYAARVRPERVIIWVSLGGANHGTNALCYFLGNL